MSSEPNATASSGLEANIAGLLCYLFGWVSGLIFLLIDKRPFVRFHAAQSIGLSVGAIVAFIVFTIVVTVLTVITAGFGAITVLLFPLIGLGIFVLTVVCMIRAYKGEKYKLPVVGNIVQKMVGD